MSLNSLFLVFTSSLNGAQDTTLRPYRQPRLMLDFILTWQQSQLKLLQQPCHDNSSLELSKCLPNTVPGTKRKWKEHRLLNWTLDFR